MTINKEVIKELFKSKEFHEFEKMHSDSMKLTQMEFDKAVKTIITKMSKNGNEMTIPAFFGMLRSIQEILITYLRLHGLSNPEEAKNFIQLFINELSACSDQIIPTEQMPRA